jgi:ketosteroid isomerase-like protein
MSEESVEVARRASEAFLRPDFDPEEFMTEDFEWHGAPEEPDTPFVRGRTTAYTAVTAWVKLLGPCDYEVRDVLDAGGDEVLVCGRVRLEGTSSDLLTYHAQRVRNGKIDRTRAFFNRDQALKAVGLEE